MRSVLLVFVLAGAGVAHADDDCRGADADTESCSALWPTHDGRTPASVTTGWVSDEFDPAGHSFEEKRLGYANQIGHFEGDRLAPMHGNGFFVDARMHVTPWIYAGVDLRAAWGDPPASTFAFAGGQQMTWDSAWLATMAGVVGARVPLGRVSVRGEMVVGIHGATLSSTAMATSADTIAPLVEPRVALELWMSPWWVLEANAGANVLDRSEHVFGLGLSFHGQAFDGRYR